MRYHDLDLWIDHGPDGTIALRASCRSHGESKDVGTLDAAVLQSDQTLLTEGTVTRAALVELGTRLYGYAFQAATGSIEWHFAQCWGEVARRDAGVRLLLRVESPILAVVPWEYVYSRRLSCFLGISERTPIVRYLELPQPIASLKAPLPVRMLLVIPGDSKLDTEREKRELLDTLAPLGDVVTITVLDGEVTHERLRETLASERFHLLHFIGHGDFDGERAVLRLNLAGGGDDLIDQQRLASLLRNHRSMKLVVLNSCRGAQLSPTKPFVGMAAELVKLGVPAVIAMQYEIEDREAVRFAGVLYRRLFTGADKGRVEIAISEARNVLADEFPDTNAVGLPVLVTHAREGVLFQLSTGSALRDLPLSPRAAERQKAVIRTHERNVELLEREPATAPDERDARDGDATLAEERNALSTAQRLLRFRNAAIAMAAGVGLLVALAAWFFGYQRLDPLFRPESYVVAFTDLAGHHHDGPSVLLVAIDSATMAAFGATRLDSTWRGRHAAVVDRLRRAGVKTIAFNLSFTDYPAPALRPANDSLARAVREARAGGVSVLVPIDSFVRGVPNVIPSLAPSVRWGANCVEDVTLLTAKALRTTIAGPTAGTGTGRPPRMHSLPLEAVAAFRGLSFRDDAPVRDALPSTGSGIAPSAVVLDSVIAGSETKCVIVQPGDTVYRMVVDYSSSDELRSRDNRVSYVDVLRGAPVPQARGRLALVGVENPATRAPIIRGLSEERRYLVDLARDAMNTLLRGTRIAPVEPRAQFAVILLMAALGALAAYLVVPFGRAAQVAAIAGAVAFYVLLGAWLYSSRHLLLNTAFDLSSLALTFIAVSVVRRIWYP